MSLLINILLSFLVIHETTGQYEKCGRNLETDPTVLKLVPERNINGESGPVGTFPWMVSIGFFDDDKWQHLCGGVLVDDNTIVTAAHCIPFDNLKIRLGDRNLDSKIDDNGVQIRDIIEENIHFHPKYNFGVAYYDVAVVKLDQSIKRSLAIRPICLPERSSFFQDEFSGYLVRISGWGTENRQTTKTSPILKVSKLKIQSTGFCNQTYTFPVGTSLKLQQEVAIPDLFQSSIMCIGDDFNNFGSCTGDSGGAVVVLDTTNFENQHFELLGLVQGGIGSCGDRNMPGIYIRLKDPEIFEFVTKFTRPQNPQLPTRRRENVDQLDKHGQSRLWIASLYNQTDQVRRLISQGADVNLSRKSKLAFKPIHIATQEGYFQVVKILVNNNADVNSVTGNGRSPFYIACQKGHISIARFLLEKGADWKRKRNNGQGPLHIAAKKGQLESSKLLVNELKADIHDGTDKGSTPLYLAAFYGSEQVLRFLIAKGANVNHQRHHDGRGPLHAAALEGQLPCVKALIESGADINLGDSDNASPFYKACANNHVDIARFLVSKGADINQKRDNGWNALFQVASYGHLQMAKYLVEELGMDVKVKDYRGRTLHDITVREKKTLVGNFLRE